MNKDNCVICNGKYTALLLSKGCYDVSVCKKHLKQISEILQERLKQEQQQAKKNLSEVALKLPIKKKKVRK